MENRTYIWYNGYNKDKFDIFLHMKIIN